MRSPPPRVIGIPVSKFPAFYEQKCTIGTGLLTAGHALLKIAIIADKEYLKFQILYFIDSEANL